MKVIYSATLLAILALAPAIGGAAAQQPVPITGTEQAGAASIDSLVLRALAVNPSIRASAQRVEAARAAIGPAGSPPDPMLMVGLMNQSLGGSDDMSGMAMRAVGVGQMIPFPGKLALRRGIAEHQLAAVQADLEAARRSVVRDVRQAYFALVFVDRSLEVLDRTERLLTDLIHVTETRYGVGTGGQQDVLKARVELARLAEDAVALQEERRAVTARLNALLDRPSVTPIAAPALPERITRAAVPADPGEIRFTSATLGSRAADSPLPPIESLQEDAVGTNPSMVAQNARIAAQAARVELGARAHLPDFDLSLQYGQRDGLSDVFSAVVSVPIPLRKGGKQDLEVREAEAELEVLQAERHALANEIRAEVAGVYAELERERTQLALFAKSILPQGRAALESAAASFQVGRVDFLTLLENQATLYRYETAYYRALTGFASRLAELERIVGREII